MSVTTNVEKMTRTAREMAEVQRDSYQALAESFTASQRRGAKLAQDGLRFFKLQEDNARAAQEWFANGVRLMQLQQRNADFAQDWLGGGVEALREQTEQNLRAADAVMRNARKQQEGLQRLGQDWVGAYGDFFTPFASYAREGLGTEDYEGLNVDEVAKRLDGLSAEQLRKVREFEKKNKSRETLIEQIDRKIKAAS